MSTDRRGFLRSLLGIPLLAKFGAGGGEVQADVARFQGLSLYGSPGKKLEFTDLGPLQTLKTRFKYEVVPGELVIDPNIEPIPEFEVTGFSEDPKVKVAICKEFEDVDPVVFEDVVSKFGVVDREEVRRRIRGISTNVPPLPDDAFYIDQQQMDQVVKGFDVVIQNDWGPIRGLKADVVAVECPTNKVDPALPAPTDEFHSSIQVARAVTDSPPESFDPCPSMNTFVADATPSSRLSSRFTTSPS